MFWRLRALVGYAKLLDGGDNSSKPIQKRATAYGAKRDAETALAALVARPHRDYRRRWAGRSSKMGWAQGSHDNGASLRGADIRGADRASAALDAELAPRTAMGLPVGPCAPVAFLGGFSGAPWLKAGETSCRYCLRCTHRASRKEGTYPSHGLHCGMGTGGLRSFNSF
jgi:hypothetical protein